MMNYNVDIYETDDKSLYRFALGISSNKILFVFGLNPSTADNKDPDQTIKKIRGCTRLADMLPSKYEDNTL